MNEKAEIVYDTSVKYKSKNNKTIDIIELENEFNKFKKNDSIKTMTITQTISMMELDSIKDLILDAKIKIENYTAGNNTSFINRARESVQNLPLIGTFAKKTVEKINRAKDSSANINDIFKSLFENFTIKQNRIIELAEMLYKMKIKLEEQTEYIENVIKITNEIIESNENVAEIMRAKRLNEMANSTLLKNKDKINNKIAPALMLANKSLDNMNKILPSLEADMLDEIGINGALNSFKDMNIMLQETMNLAMSITEASAKNTEELLLETIKIADTSNSIKYIEETQKRREKFQNTFQNVMLESLKKQEENYKKVKEMAENYKENSTLNSMIESYSGSVKSIELK